MIPISLIKFIIKYYIIIMYFNITSINLVKYNISKMHRRSINMYEGTT
jgi:hypothetical protein